MAEKKTKAAPKPKRPKVVKQTVRDLDAKSEGGGVKGGDRTCSFRMQ